MKIIGTGKYEHMPAGSEWHEGEEMAKLLVEMGAATYEETEKVEVKQTKEKKEVKPTSKK